jgi:hypothetical protein
MAHHVEFVNGLVGGFALACVLSGGQGRTGIDTGVGWQ